jgi:hypothetical protein
VEPLRAREALGQQRGADDLAVAMDERAVGLLGNSACPMPVTTSG